MIQYAEAIEIIKSQTIRMESETVDLYNIVGRILAEDIFSDISIPPFNVSAMDGFACKYSERSMNLTVIETIAAGQLPQLKVESGTCSRIMTGAMVPDGADCVVMFEHTHTHDSTIEITKFLENRNIRYASEDAKIGDLLLKKGTLITAAECAVLATAGQFSISVAKKPSIGIIATGNELVEPSNFPTGAQIRNSNGYQLYAQTLRCNGIPTYYGIAEDTTDATARLITEAEKQSNVIIISGGVSAGDFDYVPAALKQCGFELLITSVAVKPGKPTVFGRKDNCFVFGLPGNPVSNFVLFELFVRPFLFNLMGSDYAPQYIKAAVAKEIRKKKGDRTEIVPVALTADGCVDKISYHGSAHIHAYTQADGFLALDRDVDCITTGTRVNVQLIEK